MEKQIKVNYEYSDSYNVIRQWLEDLPYLIACDFEAAVKLTSEERAKYEKTLKELKENEEVEYLNIKTIESLLNASALSHPSRVNITHLSIATSPSEAKVIIVNSPEVLSLIMDYLVTTDVKQIWHNASFDFKHIFHHTDGQMPKDFEDTQILAKTILNHVEVHKAGTRLKDLAGHKYGDWAVAADMFDMSNLYDEKLLKYAAIDACATFWLWESINRYIIEQKEQ